MFDYPSNPRSLARAQQKPAAKSQDPTLAQAKLGKHVETNAGKKRGQ